MNEITPALKDEAHLVGEDWRGHDSDAWDTIGLYVIGWHVAKVYTLIRHPRFAEKRTRRAFMQEVLRDYYPSKSPTEIESCLRRTYEEIETVQRESTPHDSVPEIVKKIFEKHGKWSKAVAKLTPPKEVEEKLTCSHHCNIHV